MAKLQLPEWAQHATVTTTPIAGGYTVETSVDGEVAESDLESMLPLDEFCGTAEYHQTVSDHLALIEVDLSDRRPEAK